jgi:hypothetical protein
MNHLSRARNLFYPMNYARIPLIAALIIAAGLTTFAGANPSTSGKGQLMPISDKESAWAEKARANYPTSICVVSEDKLGGMGKPADFLYRQDGAPDRLVRFCCKDCTNDFKKEPAKYLAAIDAAAKSPKK